MDNSEDANHEITVPADIFNQIFDFDAKILASGKQTGWRKFYSSLNGNGPKVVTRSSRVNTTRGSINITGKHARSKGHEWCDASFNFTAKLPMTRDSPVMFKYKITNLNKCSCAAPPRASSEVPPALSPALSLAFEEVLTDTSFKEEENQTGGVFDPLAIDEDSVDSAFGSTGSDMVTPADYMEISVNHPVPPVTLLGVIGDDRCGCKPEDQDPCGRSSSCINVMCQIECNADTCPAEDACRNQKLSRAGLGCLQVVEVPDCGRGVITLKNIEKDAVLTEYVGELINHDEYRRRLKMMLRKNVYIFKVSDDRYIDSEDMGNISRFINHSCEPNSVSQKITVGGNTRIAIIANQFIKAVSRICTTNFVQHILNNKIIHFSGNTDND